MAKERKLYIISEYRNGDIANVIEPEREIGKVMRWLFNMQDEYPADVCFYRLKEVGDDGFGDTIYDGLTQAIVDVHGRYEIVDRVAAR